MGSGSAFGALGSLELPWGPGHRTWRLAGSKSEGTAHSEDMARAEAREPRALADCLPGLSPDGASHRAVSTNPELSQRATGFWHRGEARHLSSLPFLPLSLQVPGAPLSPETHAAHTTPRHLAGSCRTTASLVTGYPLKARLSEECPVSPPLSKKHPGQFWKLSVHLSLGRPQPLSHRHSACWPLSLVGKLRGLNS